MKSKFKSSGPALLFALCFFSYTFSYFGRNNISVCLGPMVEEGLFTEIFRGYILTAFLICYGAGQFINGRLAVRFAPQKMVFLGLLFSGVCNILMAFVTNRWLLLIIWGLNGFSNSMQWPSIIRIFSEWMSDEQRQRAGANISPTIPLGMLGCYLITFLALRFSDWHSVFLASGFLLCAGSAVWAFGMRRLRPYITRMTEQNALRRVDAAASGSSLTLKVFCATGLFTIALAAFFNGTLKDAVISMVPQYLTDTLSVEASTASLISTLLPIFSVAGPYFGIWLNRRFFDNECRTTGFLFSISLVCNACVLLFAKLVPFLPIVFISISMAAMWGVNTMLLTYSPYHFGAMGISSAVTGTLNCIAYIGSSSFTSIFNAVSVSAGGWTAVVILWTALALTGASLCFLFGGIWKNHRPA